MMMNTTSRTFNDFLNIFEPDIDDKNT